MLPRYDVVNEQQVPTWMREHCGYVPKPNQILVITLPEAVSTPEGQPIQAQTLEEVKAELKE